MRKKEIEEFAIKLDQLLNEYGLSICSDNYFTPAVIIDEKKEGGFSYHFKNGKIELDTNTFFVEEDEE